MQRALELSAHAAFVEKSGGLFGAVIVQNGIIVGEGYNQVLKQNDPTWHAEIHAIREAAKALNKPHLDGCILYTSAEPCPMCLGACYWAHIEKIFYASSADDVKKFGNFQDDDFTQEICKRPEDRIIQSIECMREQALQLWKRFQEESTIHY